MVLFIALLVIALGLAHGITRSMPEDDRLQSAIDASERTFFAWFFLALPCMFLIVYAKGGILSDIAYVASAACGSIMNSCYIYGKRLEKQLEQLPEPPTVPMPLPREPVDLDSRINDVLKKRHESR